MKELTERMISELENGRSAVLCTVLASSGSSPRGAGARMLVLSDGSTIGTVGGGRVELLAAQDGAEILKTGQNRLRAFDLVPNQVNSIGMVCGGRVSIYYQLMTQAELPILYQMRKALTEDKNSWLYLKLEDGRVEDFRIVDEAGAKAEPELFTARAVLQKGTTMRYAEPIRRAGRVLLFGGGHVGQALVPVLASVDFRVVVFDNRKELANTEHFPDAEEVIFGDYRDVFSKITIHESDYVVIMTPGHQSDFALLEQVLRHPTRYVGCIGSRHKVARAQQMLREAGIPEERIQSTHSPIGLPILAQTPAEIAISIAAEMIQCRATQQ